MTRGIKLCINCNNMIGNRTIKCVCGHINIGGRTCVGLPHIPLCECEKCICKCKRCL